MRRNIVHHGAMIGLMVTLVIVLILGGCAGEPSTGPIKLTAVTFLPPSSPRAEFYVQNFIEEVNKRSEGRIEIEYLGGSEVIATMDQGHAVSTGIVDFAFVFPTAYLGLVPAARAFKFTTLDNDELRENGAVDWVNSLHESANIHFVGFLDGQPGNRFRFFLNKKVTNLEDLDGLNIASETTLVTTMPKFGMQPLAIADEELYTAMQQGLVDGFINPLDQVYPDSLQEVTKYCLDTPFIKWGAVVNIMNLDSWNNLPKELQDIITEVEIDAEQAMYEFNQQQDAEQRQLLLDSGMEFTKLPEDEAKIFLDTINVTETEFALSTLSTDVAQKFIELFKPY